MAKKSSFSPMAQRFLTAGVLMPIGVFCIYTQLLNGLFVFIIALVFSLIGVYELCVMAEKMKHRAYLWVISIFVTLNHVNVFLHGLAVYDVSYFTVIIIGLSALLMVIIFFLESTSNDFGKAMETIAIQFLIFVLFGLMAPFITMMKMMDQSGWLITICLGIPWISDAGGLIFGVIFGKHRIDFLASPKKTVEGYIGAVFTGVVFTVILFLIQNFVPFFKIPITISLWQYIVLGVVFSIIGSIGDLGESAIKRWAGVKDSSSFLPGHGGAFDLLDSVIVTAPLLYVVFRFMGY